MSLTAYVRYDSLERIVPGGPIVSSIKPKSGDWVSVDSVLTTIPNNRLRAFIRYINASSGQNKYVAGSLVIQQHAPTSGKWKEVYYTNPGTIVAGDFIATEDNNPLITEDNNNLIIE